LPISSSSASQATELVILFPLTPTFGIADWIYVLQHLVVLGIAFTRPNPTARDYSIASSMAVIIALRLSLRPSHLSSRVGWLCGMAWRRPRVSNLRGCLSLVTLLTLGRLFGVRPAVRGLATSGPSRFIRHPMYLSYILADIGYNLEEWNLVTLLLVLIGWAALVYRNLCRGTLTRSA